MTIDKQKEVTEALGEFAKSAIECGILISLLVYANVASQNWPIFIALGITITHILEISFDWYIDGVPPWRLK